jgi:phospholipid-binding lipoprotein MlaA
MPPRYARIAFFVVVGLTLCGCASLPPGSKRDPRDPWERMNRATYKFNDGLDRAIARPVAKAYVKVTPRFVQTGVSNFFDNVAYPITIVNDLLQGKIKQTCQDTGRLVVNTTIGIGGLFDPASKMGFDKNDEDFGQTLGKWGVHPGPYLVIPFFGFSDVRDGIGRGVGIFANALRPRRNFEVEPLGPGPAGQPGTGAERRRRAQSDFRSVHVLTQCIPATASVPRNGWRRQRCRGAAAGRAGRHRFGRYRDGPESSDSSPGHRQEVSHLEPLWIARGIGKVSGQQLCDVTDFRDGQDRGRKVAQRQLLTRAPGVAQPVQ